MSSKTIITKFDELCVICNRPATDHHHCLKGVKQRSLADEDGLILPLCREHHQGNLSVHNTKELNVLCQIIGQLAWERDYLIKKYELPFDDLSTECRAAFMERYSKGYI